jgi:hypothetical protein
MQLAASIDDRLDALARQPFRAKFHLRGRERAFVQLRGMTTVRQHAFDLIGKRLAPVAPYKDGNRRRGAGTRSSSPSTPPPPAAGAAS